MIRISNSVSIREREVELAAVRAEGPGGQAVNKNSTAIHLRFDINRSSLPAAYKERLLAASDSRITKDGVIVIKAQSHRSLEMNRQDAIERLIHLIRSVMVTRKQRRPSKPTKASQRRRLEAKKRRASTKALRGRVT